MNRWQQEQRILEEKDTDIVLGINSGKSVFLYIYLFIYTFMPFVELAIVT